MLLNFVLVSTIGIDFIFGLPLAPENQISIFELIIGTAFDQTHYIIETALGTMDAGTTSSAAPKHVRADPFDLEVHSSGFADRMKGIQVRAIGEYPIQYVLVVMAYPFYAPYGHSTFLIHPNNELDGENSKVQYEYYGESTDYAGLNRKSSILLVGNFDATIIDITPTQTVSLPVDAQTNGPMVDVVPGTTHNITLHRLQTLLISSQGDLTGTRILSSRPLTVLTGHQCAQIPTTHGFCEPLYVHIPPTFNWGKRFLLAPFAGRTAPQTYRLIASRNSTIAYRCGTLDTEWVYIAERRSHLLIFPNISFCYLTATNPVFVVQVASGFLVDRLGDPAVTTVSPFTGYINSTGFFTSNIVLFSNHFISITVQAKHFSESQIRLDGRPFSCNWTGVHDINSDNTVGYGCAINISAGAHKVSHLGESGVLSVITYGWSSRPASGYAYLTGIGLEPTRAHSGGKFSLLGSLLLDYKNPESWRMQEF